jgi:lysophospholipase L1-like esterase
MTKTYYPSYARHTLLWAALAALALQPGCATHARSVGTPTHIPADKTLRIMPLGDSITRGSGYGNYRHPLQSLLAQGGYKAQFVGGSTEQSFSYHGSDPEQTFTPYQPDHEGYGGFRIDQIAADTPDKDDGGVSYPGLSHALAADKPDVVLLMLGTNDVRPFGDGVVDPGGPGYGGGTGFAADAAQHLDGLVSRLYDGRPGLTLVLATITPLAARAKEASVEALNAFIPRIVAAHRKQGQNVLLAEMHSALTVGDLSPDGVHPGTVGYDKMARSWYTALTGRAAPPLSSPAAAPHGPGRLDERNVFSPATRVTVSNSFSGGAFSGAALVDGSNKAFVFGDAHNERVNLTGFNSAIGRLRFFDTPSYTGRTPGSVTVYYSASAQSSLTLGDYTKLGVFPLPAVGDVYEHPTSPVSHPDAGEPASHPAAVIGFCDLEGLKIPAGTQSVLLDFSKNGGDGDGLTEVQAFAPAAPD